VEVFRSTRYVRRKSGATGVRMSAVSRGHGTVMYETRVCDTEAEAASMYRNFMMRNPHYVDTTGSHNK
jgi:hypothetical protein